MTSSTPAEGAGLATPPDAISLTFAEAVTVSGDPVAVTGPDGSSWTTGPATVSGDTVSVPVQPTGPAGAYTVKWSVISDDGDAVKGALHFTMSSAATPPSTAAVAAPTAVPGPALAAAPAAAPASWQQPDSTGWPWWAWVAIALVVLAVIGLIAAARSRRSVDAR